MNLNELQPASGSRQTHKRKGRGYSSGLGSTSGRGVKGQKAREGKKINPTFEGGQMPLFRRMPKRGFNNISRKEYAIVNLDVLNAKFQDGAEVTPAALVEAGIVKQEKHGIKILGVGKLDKKLSVSAHKFSGTAKAAIEAAGGSADIIAVAKTEDK